MIKITLIICLLLFNISFADSNETNTTSSLSPIEQETQKRRGFESDEQYTTYKTYDDAVETDDHSQWNTSNWQKQSAQNGANTGSIGKMQDFFKTDGNTDINKVRTDTIRQDPNAPANLKVWTQNMQDTLASNAINNNGLQVGQTVKCYIARDIPIRFQCTKTGLSYGGYINSNGLEAQKKCESECYDQSSCKEAEAPVLLKKYIDPIKVDDDTPAQEKSVLLPEGIPLDKITMQLSSDQNATVKIKVFITAKNKESIIADLSVKDKNITLPLGFRGEKISVLMEQTTAKTKSQLDAITIHYKEQGKYICPLLQDISLKNPGNYAFSCPSGKIKSFSIQGSTYKICEDYGVVGDNLDGTFSTLEGCQYTCKKKYQCTQDIRTYNENVLKQFREGCIEGQENCRLDTCTNLRNLKTPILNETVFDATSKPVQTIVSSAYQEGTYRPKPVVDTDLAFSEKLAEEYKEKAYMQMLLNGTYTSAKVTLDENTQSDSAFAISVGNNLEAATLYWQYKPASFDVSSGKFKFYTVVEVIAQRMDYVNSLKKNEVRNRILYVKKDTSSMFYPFAIKENAEYTTIGENDELLATTNTSARWEYKTFTGGTWYYIPPTNILEHYKSEPIEMETVVMRTKVINDMSTIFKGAVPGIVRSIATNGPIETKKYTGDFDGTGEFIANYKVYAFVLPENQQMSYQDFVQKIDNGSIKPFFDSIRRANFKQVLEDDGNMKMQVGETNEYEIKSYQYGKINNKTGFVEITPKKEDVGKNGYVFIFAYDPALDETTKESE
jgi:hypothetical protein